MDVTWILSFFADPKYWILFILFLVEGPIVNFIASMIAVTGVLNIWVIIPMAIGSNILGDVIHYFLGSRISNIKFTNRFSKMKDRHIFESLERLLVTHFYKALFIIKIIPAFSSIGLLYIGKKRLSFKKFFLGSVIFSITFGLFISFLGYSVFGSVTRFLYYFNIYQKMALIIAVFIVLAFLIYYFRENIKSFFLKIFFKSRGLK